MASAGKSASVVRGRPPVPKGHKRTDRPPPRKEPESVLAALLAGFEIPEVRLLRMEAHKRACDAARADDGDSPRLAAELHAHRLSMEVHDFFADLFAPLACDLDIDRSAEFLAERIVLELAERLELWTKPARRGGRKQSSARKEFARRIFAYVKSKQEEAIAGGRTPLSEHAILESRAFRSGFFGINVANATRMLWEHRKDQLHENPKSLKN